MLIVLSLFFLVVWLVFLKFKWLPFNRTWKIVIWTTISFLDWNPSSNDRNEEPRR